MNNPGPKKETIKIGPDNWVQCIPLISAALKHGTPKGQLMGYQHLIDMAKAADLASEFLEILRNGLESGVFDDAPVFKRDVVKLLKKAGGAK